MMKEQIKIPCRDGYVLNATLLGPEGNIKGSIVIASAMGVPQKFYEPFARYLAENGYQATIFDYRGIARPGDQGKKGRHISYTDWGALDIDAVLLDSSKRAGSKPLFMIGHSTGGQLWGLAPNSEKLSGIVLAPSSSAHWRLFPFPFRPNLLFLYYILIPGLCAFMDYFPARRLGISSIDIPGGAIRQWARFARNREFMFSPRFGLDTHRYKDSTLPILAYGFSDDSYANDRSIRKLLSNFPQAKIDYRWINVSKLGIGGIGHFGFFKEKTKDTLWQQTLVWLETMPRS